jgi:hypothetical protein
MLHHSAIPSVIERKDNKGKPVVFDITFVKLSTGEIVHAPGVQCTSSHFEPRTYNIKLQNGEIRKVRHVSILKINGKTIYA